MECRVEKITFGSAEMIHQGIDSIVKAHIQEDEKKEDKDGKEKVESNSENTTNQEGQEKRLQSESPADEVSEKGNGISNGGFGARDLMASCGLTKGNLAEATGR